MSGDREFIGDFWLRQLVKLDIKFVIRLKNNRKCQVWFNNGLKDRPITAKALHRYMDKKGINAHEIVLAGDYIVQFIVLKNAAAQPDEPFLYLITNVDDVEKAAALYKIRWKIECCFKHLKTNGFNLEKQSFTAPHKVEILMSLLVLVYAMAIYEGVIIHQTQDIKMKTYKLKAARGEVRSVTYPEISVFRAGMNKIEQTIKSIKSFIRYLEKIVSSKWIQYQQNIN